MVSTQIITLNSHHPFTINGSISGPNVMYTLSCAASKGGVALLPSFAQSSDLIGLMLDAWGRIGGEDHAACIPRQRMKRNGFCNA
jgi:hypothetical protein